MAITSSVAISTFYHFGWGVALKAMTNSVMKVPLRREPWEYLMFGALGAYVGYKMPEWQQNLIDNINEMHEERGLPPLDVDGQFSLGSKFKQLMTYSASTDDN
uniref:Uncharacterized protein n=1 Tax=Fibrocapsa japonica TaxID=94617 RepID=A0A7S2V622_9STRA|mmetsp:Transcript_4478/g.6699  ORF Transcript_4478/g.6699 Transcript_4478/m.6699 type:complete len:103 (+) Transcript_4478:65-373(+)